MVSEVYILNDFMRDSDSWAQKRTKSCTMHCNRERLFFYHVLLEDM